MICPSARSAPLARQYSDIDFVADSGSSRQLEPLFVDLGYTPDGEFNALHGESRRFFHDPGSSRLADVFLNQVRGCHLLDVRDRLGVCELTIPPADLLLSKLQVLETNEKDFQDAVALLKDHDLTEDDSGINLNRIEQVCARDWGWWKTVTIVAARTRDYASGLATEAGADPGLGTVVERIDLLLERLEEAPKSRRWKLRARVGEKVRWHEEPEDIEHAEAG
ncbi:MAG: hypothetical protein JST31_00770 [Actinobacteria bacterium]|nr:hypothetical protein [Actinomycetota bacterium]